ncbi:hypothetical protein MKZ02_22810 [Pseudobacillus sp. FSL P4-0506]|uniref:hypothetical protein n=1 Tax=Pseudobacillus sp. FSL P4-0506 TaxID=2921576 RepID=UPI0030FBF7AF
MLKSYYGRTAVARDDGIYVALSGVNPNEKIFMIEVDLQTEDYSYRTDVPKGDYFTMIDLLPYYY